MRLLSLLFFSLVTGAAHANTWTFENNEIKLPAPAKGASLTDLTMVCVNNTFFLSVTGEASPTGSPAALLVDNDVFATQAGTDGRFAVPTDAVAALKKGKKFTISLTASKGKMEGSFSLKGSGKALEALEGACASVPTIAFESAVSYVAANRMEISHTASDEKRKLWIGIVQPGADPKSFMTFGYGYSASSNPVTFTAPAVPGTYELRLVDEEKNEIIYAKPVTITAPVAATVSGPETIAGAGKIDIGFTGPDGEHNYVGIVPKGVPANVLPSIQTALTGKTQTRSVFAPITPGEYELRFVAFVGQPVVLASQPISVTAAPAVTLQQAEVAVGGTVNVALPADLVPTGGDYIYIAKPGTPDYNYDGGYVYVSGPGQVEIKAPAEAGDWELRFISTDNGQYIARAKAALKVN